MSTVHMKQGDRLPVLQVQLLDASGAAIDVSTATVTFQMRAAQGGAMKIEDGPCTQPNGGTDGLVQYAWRPGDTDTVGAYLAEFACDFDGLVRTAPTNGYVTVQVVDALGV